MPNHSGSAARSPASKSTRFETRSIAATHFPRRTCDQFGGPPQGQSLQYVGGHYTHSPGSVSRRSATTLSPASSRRSAGAEPMQPWAPVTGTLTGPRPAAAHRSDPKWLPHAQPRSVPTCRRRQPLRRMDRQARRGTGLQVVAEVLRQPVRPISRRASACSPSSALPWARASATGRAADGVVIRSPHLVRRSTSSRLLRGFLLQ